MVQVSVRARMAGLLRVVVVIVEDLEADVVGRRELRGEPGPLDATVLEGDGHSAISANEPVVATTSFESTRLTSWCSPSARCAAASWSSAPKSRSTSPAGTVAVS